ncbi:hypothetical protein C8R45DRAFT_1095670 [Mycena sanguinolenta]|nr:hypothetical protein C8R45DRAFT_1095670 [Mycena sanguinolenta]
MVLPAVVFHLRPTTAEGGNGGKDATFTLPAILHLCAFFSHVNQQTVSFLQGIPFNSLISTSKPPCRLKTRDVCISKIAATSTLTTCLSTWSQFHRRAPLLPRPPAASLLRLRGRVSVALRVRKPSGAPETRLCGKRTRLSASSATNLPPPKSIAMEHASKASPLPVKLAADEFRTTRVAWTGLGQNLQHPHLDRWQDTQFLKTHLNYLEWDGRTSHAFVEAKGRIVGALIGAPNDPTWPAVVQRATGALHHEWLGMSFPSAAYEHRRSDFAQDALG